MFWYGWNSWLVELLGGASLSIGSSLLIKLTCLLTNLTFAPWGILLAFCSSLIISLVYEFKYDVNKDSETHKPWNDIGQRTLGSILGVIVIYLLL